MDGLVEHGQSRPSGRLLRTAFRPVETDKGVQMNQPAGLELGDLRERHPEFPGETGTADARVASQPAPQVDREPLPEQAGVGIPQDGAVIVEAACAQGLSDQRVAGLVPLVAPVRAAVGAGWSLPSGPAGE